MSDDTNEPAAALLRAEGAAFGYRGRKVLSAVDLSIARGSILGVVGSNGPSGLTMLYGRPELEWP